MKDFRAEILDFWFVETAPAQWFQKNPEFDASIRARFEKLYRDALAGLYDHWKQDADGCLALCILLDQFPRNMYRGDAKSFEADGKALEIARHAVQAGLDQVITPARRRFIYLPFEHSENLSDQRQSLALFATLQDEDPLGYEYALRHYNVIEAYGRFPHRNQILGRENAPDETEYLARPDSGF